MSLSLGPMLWVIVYDVGNDTRRRRLHALLKQYGDPVQDSAFEARLTRSERKALLERASRIIDPSSDKVFLYPLVRAKEGDIVALGQPRVEVRRRTYWIL
jgi:CRISPR-associated endonuclease Cas2